VTELIDILNGKQRTLRNRTYGVVLCTYSKLEIVVSNPPSMKYDSSVTQRVEWPSYFLRQRYNQMLSGLIILLAGLALSVSCTNNRDGNTAKAKGQRESITVYTALTPLYGSSIPTDYFERFADITGFDINVVTMYEEDREGRGMYTKSWYAMREGPNKVIEYWDIYNPVRAKSEPDIILSTIDDSYIADKAEAGFFLTASEVLDDAPEFRISHGATFWDANFAFDEFGIPLYSFQSDDAPAYWIIDADLRSQFSDEPIETFEELLGFAEFAAASVPGDKPVVATSTIPLGAIALQMAKGYLPVYVRFLVPNDRRRWHLMTPSLQSIIYGNTEDEKYDSRVVRSSFLFEIQPPERNIAIFLNLAHSPLVFDPRSEEIRNIISNPPSGYWDIVQRICDLGRTGRLDTMRDQASGAMGFLVGSIKALFIVDDPGLSFLEELMNRFPTNYRSRFEIVPASQKPVADLQSYFRAWVPASTDRKHAVAKWLDTLANPDVYEPLRYGLNTQNWRADSDTGIAPGNSGELREDAPPGFLMEVLTRVGLPERVPSIVPETLRSAFRLEDRRDDSFTRLEYRYVKLLAVEGLPEMWREFSDRYSKLLAGKLDFTSTIDYLRTYGERMLSVIEESIEYSASRERVPMEEYDSYQY
jgi:hypothetical protein